jgi:hypothetical protein
MVANAALAANSRETPTIRTSIIEPRSMMRLWLLAELHPFQEQQTLSSSFFGLCHQSLVTALIAFQSSAILGVPIYIFSLKLLFTSATVFYFLCDG